jgi:cell division protein FtsN
MRWYQRKTVEIVSGIIVGIIALFFLFVVRFYTKIENNEVINSNDYLTPGNIPLMELNSEVIQRTSPKESAMRETTLIDSSKINGNLKVQVDYYIIVGSFKNLEQAQQKADKLTNEFNTNIILLPATKEGYFRISCGKYSTLEKAEAAIKNIRTNINSNAWILSLKE